MPPLVALAATVLGQDNPVHQNRAPRVFRPRRGSPVAACAEQQHHRRRNPDVSRKSKAVGKCVWCDRRIPRPKGICERCGPYLVRQAREALARKRGDAAASMLPPGQTGRTPSLATKGCCSLRLRPDRTTYARQCSPSGGLSFSPHVRAPGQSSKRLISKPSAKI